jgi:hypothetical protein
MSYSDRNGLWAHADEVGNPPPASKLLAQESQVPSPRYCPPPNFEISERLGESIWEAPITITHLPSEPQDEEGNLILADGLSNLFPGCSELREEMARNVEKMGLTRPVGGKIELTPY